MYRRYPPTRAGEAPAIPIGRAAVPNESDASRVRGLAMFHAAASAAPGTQSPVPVQEQLVGRVFGFFGIGVLQRVEMQGEVLVRPGRHLNSGKDAPVVRTMVAVVEQTDVPAA